MKEMFIEICKEENIQCHFLSKDWICVLEKDGVRKVIAGYKFALDDHALGTVIDDKYALYSLLNLGNISVVTHHIFYGENVKQSYAEGCNTFQDLEKLFFVWQDAVEIAEDSRQITIGQDLEGQDGIRFSKLTIRK